MSGAVSSALAAGTGLLSAVAYLRWWRVSQREHYEPGRVLAIAALWTRTAWWNAAAGLVLVALGVAGCWITWLAPVTALALLAWPLGLDLWHREKPLAWTPRVRRLAAITVVLHVVACVVLGYLGVVALVPLLVPFLADAAAGLAMPVERRISERFVRQAQERIRQVAPAIVAITGSYGKTSTKNYTAHLLAGTRSVVASPASFNNRMGLSRAVNDRLRPGTEVFVAEMGTYGPGEIRNLCKLFPPAVSAIVTIGEAHLERMKTRETIVRAKSEITETAPVVVLNTDDPDLAALAGRLQQEKRVVGCSTRKGSGAEVAVVPEGADWIVLADGEELGRVPAPHGGHPVNLAIAIGLTRALDVDWESILRRLKELPSVAHRAEVARMGNGVAVIDDTYNSNPTGAAEALMTARRLVGPGGRIYTITPGMVELGAHQDRRNAEFARAATEKDDMVLAVVGRTNRAALARGADGRVEYFSGRAKAVQDIMARVREGDVVLYENDLPDHYP
ncbi:MAG TPA: UDP-N-acetylmuramoyl-tripeptide--D-alanyl-D-alanine ligase [Marmoricola sp.]